MSDSLAGALEPTGFALAAGQSLEVSGTVGPLEVATSNTVTGSCFEGGNGSGRFVPEFSWRRPSYLHPVPQRQFQVLRRQARDPSGASFRLRARERGSGRSVRPGSDLCDALRAGRVLQPRRQERRGHRGSRVAPDVLQGELADRARASRTVLDRDRFGDEKLLVGGSIELCAPAIKNSVGQLSDLESRANHYQCYSAATAPGATPLTPGAVTLAGSVRGEQGRRRCWDGPALQPAGWHHEER